MIDAVLIYVALPDEAVQVWRPIQAERWEFERWEMVYCEHASSSDGPILAAVRRA